MPEKTAAKQPVETDSLFEFLAEGQGCSLLALLLRLSDRGKPPSSDRQNPAPART